MNKDKDTYYFLETRLTDEEVNVFASYLEEIDPTFVEYFRKYGKSILNSYLYDNKNYLVWKGTAFVFHHSTSNIEYKNLINIRDILEKLKSSSESQLIWIIKSSLKDISLNECLKVLKIVYNEIRIRKGGDPI